MDRIHPAWSWVGDKLLYPARHIRWKIIAPYIVLTIVLAGAGTYIATRLVTGTLEERFENQLAEAARVTSDSVVRRERQHLEVVRGVAFTEGVAAALNDADEGTLTGLVEPLAGNSGAEIVHVLDSSGEQIIGVRLSDEETLAYEPLAAPEGQATWPVVRQVLQGESDPLGDKFAQIAQTDQGFALYSAGPIFDGDKLVGVVLVGSLLDSFLPVAKAEALADITFYDFDGISIATTFATSGDQADTDLTPGAGALDASGNEGAFRENKDLFGRGFDLLYGEIVIRDQAVGIYSVALPSSFILGAGGATRWQLGLLFAISTTAVLGIGWALAGSLTRPLLKLVKAARAVTAGDLTARSGVRTSDEVGMLAASFDTMTERLQRQHLATIRALTSAIDARDPNTAGHSARVGQLAVTIGRELGLPEAQLQHLEIGGYLHDIGKIGVRDSVLLKPGQLTPEERELIQQHPRVGLEILSSVDLAPDVIAFVWGHHEKLDGSGYPSAISGSEVTAISRIAVVADMYDALTTARPYRPALSTKHAFDIISTEADAGKLDHHVVNTFRSLMPAWERRRRSDPTLRGFILRETPAKEAA